ncbi:MAG: hypothetical protein SNG49_08910 [Rikenellaceae bacterium]
MIDLENSIFGLECIISEIEDPERKYVYTDMYKLWIAKYNEIISKINKECGNNWEIKQIYDTDYTTSKKTIASVNFLL